jgi:hypothetical protein
MVQKAIFDVKSNNHHFLRREEVGCRPQQKINEEEEECSMLSLGGLKEEEEWDYVYILRNALSTVHNDLLRLHRNC